VGSQYMNNVEGNDAELDAYFTTDFQFQWEKDKLLGLNNVKFTALVNNLFNAKYASNGYMYDETPYYFPQAGINFLLGLDLSL
jgi:iron complex outermembrane receptor protein